VLGTQALAESGDRGVEADQQANECFEQALEAFSEMGDLVRQVSGLQSFANYLSQRGNDTRLANVEARLSAAQQELRQVSGAH
jgi:hypothetical protein